MKSLHLTFRKNRLLVPVIITILSLFTGSLYPRGGYRLKYASLAPAGSIWAEYIDKIAATIEKETNGEVDVKVYYGGVAGDEKAMAKKLKAGLIDIAAFTGIGLGEILPSIRMFELPMLFSSYNEVDKLKKELFSYYQTEFQKVNLTFAEWGEGGFVYLMSRAPVRSANDLQGKKIWAPTGDPVVRLMFEKYGFVPVNTGMESVLTQLQTGGIEAVYAPPMAAIGLQWHSEVSYITDLPLTYSVGATLLNSNSLKKLPEETRKIVIDIISRYSNELTQRLRSENEKALQYLTRTKGLKLVEMGEKERSSMYKRAREVQQELAGSLYPEELWKRSEKILRRR